MGYGEMVATNSTIYLNTHGEMVLRLNGAMVKWRNSEINIDKWQYGETKRFFFTVKRIHIPFLTQFFADLI